MASETNTTNASFQAVDAYRTYLFRNGKKTVSQIEAIKPGQIIPLDDLEHDIAIVQKTIQTVEKFGMPAAEEKAKLKGLLNLKAGLLNQPSSFIAKEVKTPPGKKMNVFGFLEPDDKALPTAESAPAPKVGYNVKLGVTKKNPILMVKPQPVKKAVSIMAAGASLTQELLMQIGMLANGNVLIYQTMGAVSKYGEHLTLRCKQCGTDKHLDDTLSLVSSHAVTDEIAAFCKLHRHEPGVPDGPAPAPQEAGRFFRDEE